MDRKIENASGRKDRAKSDADTAAYGEKQGATGRATDAERKPRMPHERDESARATGNRLDQDRPPSEREISQAGADLDAGRVDTDRRGIPNDVPVKQRRGRR